DNPTNREIVRRQLSAWGMRVDDHEDGPSALAAVDAGRAYDVVLLDMHMPGMDGIELARGLRERSATRALPLLLLTSLIVFYAYLVEFFIAWYSGSPFERAIFWDRVTGQYAWAGWIMYTCNCIIPMALWSRRVRTSWFWMFVISIFVNIGMWFERFVIIIQSLAHEFIPYMWDYYTPTWVEWGITTGSFAWFFMWFLLFVKFLPSMAIAELKELLPPRLKRQKEELAAR
ncbi:MAG: response regulator, partial [Gemmatimonadetes bacterium]|nr:response regulator [Gemmatimonadota bacterium]